MAGIELRSTAFNDGAFIPRRYAKEGDDVSPALSWSGVPEGTAELLLLCEDPDAPSGTFLHWLVTGIDPACDGVDTGGTPRGGRDHGNGYGGRGWGGPQPPAGDTAHRYLFHLYALPEPVDLPDRAGAGDVHAAVDERHLASGTLIGLYQR
ncbi:YbhB/YbcL family Raf kinase inhibitor-like protein [Streptomyces sp. WAC05374]|uniref:YbhB/YbcL family Raf kinase inhibitor-like protein n=1 Tax=Streptomyces sp. WAC05374 TaxID=2487420 RepID=UPI000F86F192|nr:YbhB/YbcL family Raf kinase inhibitor-like protein [Streptomyces sp. WAC05374]RST15914.1 YbhB/YbcL family Raf kinase inhibitor-like protein [Streptomyces sp. WAC05374]TDF54540.1 YbhB/YbcL family Raf kinase inhibitor-like protein [Streptomyces sp. WAC05374]TDF56175.1 YbhB/YbcL family Raf kinase inhibitor-like protein [Streptomyces sp. WAC05374]